MMCCRPVIYLDVQKLKMTVMSLNRVTDLHTLLQCGACGSIQGHSGYLNLFVQ